MKKKSKWKLVNSKCHFILLSYWPVTLMSIDFIPWFSSFFLQITNRYIYFINIIKSMAINSRNAIKFRNIASWKFFEKNEATSVDLKKFQATASNMIWTISLDETSELIFLIPVTKCTECGTTLFWKRCYKMVTCYTTSGTQLGRRCNITFHPTFPQKDGKRLLQMDSFL